MKNCRTWGNPPYTVAVIHGGPGAAGEMAAVAVSFPDLRGLLNHFRLNGQ